VPKVSRARAGKGPMESVAASKRGGGRHPERMTAGSRHCNKKIASKNNTIMMMRNIFSLSICCLLLIGGPVAAQTKRLDLEQAWGLKRSLTKPINTIEGWADARHYIEYDVQARQAYQVAIQNGQRTPYAPPPSSNMEVY